MEPYEESFAAAYEADWRCKSEKLLVKAKEECDQLRREVAQLTDMIDNEERYGARLADMKTERDAAVAALRGLYPGMDEYWQSIHPDEMAKASAVLGQYVRLDAGEGRDYEP